MIGSRSTSFSRRAAGCALVLMLGVALVACGTSNSSGASANPSAVPFVGTVHLDPDHGPAGTPVTVRGSGLSRSASLQLAWSTFDGHWQIAGKMNENYMGRAYDPVRKSLGAARTDVEGNLEATFVAPSDFGFAHDVLVVQGDRVLNKALFSLDMSVAISPESGPVGTPITITVNGIGTDSLESSRTVLYDNTYTGWMSAVTTHGTATAMIPATGAPGRHVITIGRGAFTFPYLNPAQSPRKDILVYQAVFTVTNGPAVQPPTLTAQNPGAVPTSSTLTTSGPALRTDLSAGPVGTSLQVTGSNLAPGTELSLGWHRIVGNRVGGQGWDEQRVELETVHVGADGTFATRITVPHDVGGNHRLEVMLGNQELASATFRITPSALPLQVSSGPVGTRYQIQLTGVGWTETANIYTLVVDNSYIGYACGFNSQGDVTIPMTAAGEPGWHYIDLYPAIYKGKETAAVQNFRIPQLTFAADHPGEDLPAFHFAFEVTGPTD